MSHNAIFLATGNAIIYIPLRDVKLTNGQYLNNEAVINFDVIVLQNLRKISDAYRYMYHKIP